MQAVRSVEAWDSYDANGRLESVTEAGKTITRHYNTLGQLDRFTDGAGNVIAYKCDRVSNLTELTYPEGSTVSGAAPCGHRTCLAIPRRVPWFRGRAAFCLHRRGKALCEGGRLHGT